jgi:hypothetical protein
VSSNTNSITRRIVWQYQGDDDTPFFSPTRGSAQRLPNGNTLITVSDSAHVFEVTSGGKRCRYTRLT